MRKNLLSKAKGLAVAVMLLGAVIPLTVFAQDGPEEGYYYFNTSIAKISGQGMCYVNDNDAWRIHQHSHSYGRHITTADLPFVFKLTKTDDGYYNIRSYVSGAYMMRYPDRVWGQGVGFGDTPARFTIAPQNAGYSIVYSEDNVPSHGGAIYAQTDGFVGFWGDGTKASNVWFLDKVDSTELQNPVLITDVPGTLADGYYYINFSMFKDTTTCLVPSDNNGLWRLMAYPRDDNEEDNSFIWHITRNADDSTYSFKNCGEQDFTYIENVSKGDTVSPYIIMTGKHPERFRIRFTSDGMAYIYSTSNSFNYSITGNTGNIQTSRASNAYSAVQFIPVPTDRITNSLKLMEAITDARGMQYVAGHYPGQVKEKDYEAFNSLLAQAAEEWDSEADHSEMISKLREAVKEMNEKVNPIADGYYRFANCKDNTRYLKPVYKEGQWYLGHEVITDPSLETSIIWHVTSNGKGGYIMKNCGTQDDTYFCPIQGGYKWGYVSMTGTQESTQSFVNVSSNVYRIYSSGNNNLFNGDTGKGFTYGLITTNNDYHPLDGTWTMVSVDENEVPALTLLGEAITDATGAVKDAHLGPNPGDMTGDATELQNAISDARTLYDQSSTDEEQIKATTTKLKEALAAFKAQEHSPRPVEDGYFYLRADSKAFTSDANKGYIAMRTDAGPYLKWQEADYHNPAYVFYIAKLSDGNYSLRNLLTGLYVGRAEAAGIASDSTQTTAQTISYALTRDGEAFYRIKNTVDRKAYALLTMENDLSGAITTGYDDAAHSVWHLVRLTDPVLTDSLVKAADTLRIKRAMEAALADANTAYDATFRYDIDTDNGLITTTDEDDPHGKGQLWGTQESSVSGDKKGAYSSYASLLNGKIENNCFQSTWNTANLAGGLQQFQADLRNNPVQNFKFYFGLRDNVWGYRELWSDIDIYACNDEAAAADENFDQSKWTHVGRYTDVANRLRPVGATALSTGRSLYYTVSGMDKKYRFIRFIVNKTVEPQKGGMFCLSEFQIYDAAYNEAASPYHYVDGLKAEADNLKSLIAEGRSKTDDGTANGSDIAALLTATARVKALTPLTDTLSDKIAEIKAYVGKFSDGDQTGDVTTEQLEQMNSALDAAMSCTQGTPSKANLQAGLKALNEAFAAYKAAQIKPRTDKWYYIVNTDTTRIGAESEGGTGKETDKWVNGNVIMAPRNNSLFSRNNPVVTALTWGGYTHGSANRADSIASDAYSMWRIVKIEGEDDAYALQNRATGRYIGPAAKAGRFGLVIDPVPYRFTLLQSGEVNITYGNDSINRSRLPLYADSEGFVSAKAGGINTPASWNLEPVGDDVTSAEISILSNDAVIMTLPYAYTEAEAAVNKDNNIRTYTLRGISEDGKQLQLAEKNSFKAGEPMIVVSGDPALYSPDDEKIRMALPLAGEFSFSTTPVNGLTGNVDYIQAFSEGLIIKGGTVTQAIGEPLDGQRGYINAAAIDNISTLPVSLTLPVNGIVISAINRTTAHNSAEKVNVYSTDGILLKHDVERNRATDGLSKGIYIIGKEKVMVR